MWRAQSDGRLFGLIVVGLAATGWAAVALIDSSGSGSQFSHHALGEAPIDVSGRLLQSTAVFLSGWVLMTVAMMLPTTLPLVMLFGSLTSRRPGRVLLLTALLFGYVAVWLLFGALAYGFDIGIHRVVESHAWLHRNPWLPLALTLLAAGAYQFTPLKHLCLEKCRSPYSFILEQWHGRNPRLEALRVGLSHGLFCLGCCWTLMLLMFAVSISSLVWMVALAIVMGAEKNFAWGKTLGTYAGVILATAGLTLIAVNASTVGGLGF